MLETLEFWLNQLTSLEFWIRFLAAFKNLGPAAPIFLAMIESLIPALPLVAIVTFNITAHGTILGFLYSWLGSTLGCYLVFCFFRYPVRRFLQPWLTKKAALRRGLAWVAGVDRKVLFLLAMLPFTPSSFLNMAFGLSDFDQRTFFITLFFAKALMMSGLAFFGSSVVLSFENPWFLIPAAGILAALILISRHYSRRHGL